MTCLVLCMLCWALGFAHARFSDYALKTKLWPYNKPETSKRWMGPYREPATVTPTPLADLLEPVEASSALPALEIPTKEGGPRIVRPGPKEWTTSCTGCGSRFTYTLRHCTSSKYSDAKYVACPACKKDIFHMAL